MDSVTNKSLARYYAHLSDEDLMLCKDNIGKWLTHSARTHNLDDIKENISLINREINSRSRPKIQ